VPGLRGSAVSEIISAIVFDPVSEEGRFYTRGHAKAMRALRPA